MPPNTPEQRSARAEFIADLVLYKEYRNMLPAKQALMASINQTISDLPAALEVILSPLDTKNPADQGCKIDLYYQDPDFVNWYVTFNNVYFTEVSQSASQAGAEGSSEPLYEIYQFIASDRKIKMLR